MGRSKLREKVFRLLFRAQFHSDEDFKEQETLFFRDEEQEQMEEADKEQVKDTCDRILEKCPEIDSRLAEKVKGWDIARIGKAEFTILRLAVYEILFDESIPVSVSINEAVELAKKYGQEESSSFVNGVLAKFAD